MANIEEIMGNEEIDLSLSAEALKETSSKENIEEVEEIEENEEELEGTGKQEEEEVGEEQKTNNEKGEDIVKAYARLLKEEGILDDIDDIKSFDDLIKKEREKGDRAIEEFISDLPPKLAEQLKAHSRGIDIEEVSETLESLGYLESLNDKTIKEDVKIATNLYRNLMKLEGEDSSYIEEMVQIALDSDTIGKQGVRAKNKLVGVHKKELEIKENEKILEENKIKKVQNEWASTLNSVLDGDKEIWETKLNAKEKKEIKSILYDTVETRNINGQKVGITRIQKAIEEDPLTLVQIAMGIQKGMFGKDGKLTVVKTKAKNETVESLEKAIKDKMKITDNNSDNNSVIADYSKSTKAIRDMFAGLKI